MCRTSGSKFSQVAVISQHATSVSADLNISYCLKVRLRYCAA